MATTANYGWTKPTVLGDVGAWGTIANTLFDAVDTEVKARQTQAAAAQTDATTALVDILETANAPIDVSSCSVLLSPSAWAAAAAGQTDGSLNLLGSGAAGPIFAVVSIPQMPVGLRITAINSRIRADDANCSVIVKLCKRAFTAGGPTIIAQHTVTNTGAGVRVTTTTGSLTEDIVANTVYYWHVTFQRTSGTGVTSLESLQLTITRP